jgi:hypothetical protein
MNRKSIASPPRETSRMGRRPNRSDSMPRIGPQKSCIRPQTVAKTTFHSEAAAVSPPVNCLMRLGRTGIMMPNETALITAAMKMKRKA